MGKINEKIIIIYMLQIKFDLRFTWLNLSWFLIPFFS